MNNSNAIQASQVLPEDDIMNPRRECVRVRDQSTMEVP